MSKTKEKTVLVSVILPAYNRRATIERAIRSVFEQGLENIEILVADDASTDGTAEVAARMDSRVCVLRLPENSGPASARNVALQRATGKYVAFLDSDDEWLSGKLDRQIGFLERNSRFGLCATSCKFILSDGRTIERIVKNSTDWRRVLHSSQPFHGASTTVAPRWILKTVGYQDESLRVLEDWDWCLRIAIHHPIHVIEEPLANIYENQPTNPFLTFEATRRFLKKHEKEFMRYGMLHFLCATSQHWENVARNQFFYGKNSGGCSALLRSFLLAPWRNPLLLPAIFLAFFDWVFSSRLLVRILRFRAHLSNIPALTNREN